MAKPRWKAKDGAAGDERPRGGAAKPFKAAGKQEPWQARHAKRPPADPRDTSKRFVPPKKPRS